MRTLAIITICFLFLALLHVPAVRPDRTGHPYASGQPVSEPRVFAESVISSGDYETHPAFTPDGRTLYFVKSTPTFSFWTILVSHFRQGRWSEPRHLGAPVNSVAQEWYPTLSSRGTLYFGSSREGGRSATDIYRSRKCLSGCAACAMD